MWNLFAEMEGGTESESVWEYGAEENIGPEGDEVTTKWRKQNNEELSDLY